MLQDDEQEIRRAGARYMIEMRDVVDLLPIADELGTLPEDSRILAISALASAGVTGALPVLVDLAGSGGAAERTAAIEAIGILGDAAQVPLLIPVHMRQGDLELKFISSIASLGNAADIGVQELSIETFLPADEATEQTLRALAG